LDSSQFSGGLNRAMRETNAAVGRMSAQFRSLKDILVGGAVGSFAVNIVGDMMQAAMQAEKLEAALSATTGNKLIGQQQMTDVKKLAAEIGLGVEKAAKTMIQFQSAGMGAADSMRFIKAGFNAVVATGGGDEEFKRVAYGIQQVLSAGRFLQEDINIIREALPTAGKLMKETFGANRAEDLQKLGISTREFVSGLVAAMEKLPQVGDTMLKQISRFQIGLDEMKATLGETLMPAAGQTMSGISGLLQALKWVGQELGDALFALQTGEDPFAVRAETAARAKIAELVQKEKEALAAKNEQATKDEASKNKSIEQGKTLAKVFGKFNDIIKETAVSSRELAAALDFEGRMRAFTDQEASNAFEASLDKTRAELDQSIKDKRSRDAEKRGEAFNDFVGPQQMGDDEREDWRQRVQRAGMNKSERRAARDADRQEKEDIRKAADRKTREQMQEIKKNEREKSFENAKQGKWLNEEATRRKLKDANRKSAEEAVKGAAQTLTDIKDILNKLATA
jgi:tape measure domain-containing protein